MASWRKGGDAGGRKRPGDGGHGEHAKRPARPDPEGHAKPPPTPGRTSWRKQKQAAPAVKGGSSPESRYYRRTGGFFGFLFGRRIKLWTLGLTFTGLLVGIVWVLLNWPSAVPVVSVAVSVYKDPRIPQNVTALTDLDRIEHLQSDTEDFRRVGIPIDKTDFDYFSDAFARTLKEVTPGGSAFSRKSMIIYVSAHGVVNAEGKPCLLLADSDPLIESKWYPLANLLSAIKGQTRLRDATKLLILDCCKLRSEWRLGILENQFVDRVQEEIRQAEVPNLAVLTSASAGEQSWSAPEFGGGTVFGHFFAVGLRGAAAKHSGARMGRLAHLLPKETLSVGELSDFVSNRVSRWVAATRGAPQHPQLLTRTKAENAPLRKTDLAWIGRHDPKNELSAGALRQRDDAKSREMLSALKEFWARHQKLSEIPAWRLFPTHWTELELRLLRFEELYLDAVSESEALDKARKEVEDAFKPLDDPLPAIVYPGSEPLGRNYRVVAADDGPGTIEACFSRMIERYIEEPDRRKFAREIEQTTQIREQAEALAAPVDPRVLYWLRPVLKSLDEDRRRAEDLLFVGNPESLAQVEEIRKKLSGGADSNGTLPLAEGRSQAVAQALRRRDEIWTRVWWLARWINGGVRSDGAVPDGLPEELDKLIAASDRLTQDLELIHVGESPNIAETSATAGQAFDELLAAFHKVHSAVRKSPEELSRLKSSGSFGALYGLLMLPVMTGSDRELLREKHDRVVGKLRESRDDLIKEWMASNESESTDAATGLPVAHARQVVERLLSLAPSADDDATKPETRALRAETTIRQSLAQTYEMIKSAAAPSEKTVDADRMPAGENPGDEPWLAADLARRAGWSASDVLARRRAWFVPRLESVMSKTDRTWQSPARRLMQVDLAALALWHCDRSLDDFWGPLPGGADKQPYFSRVARAFLAATTGDEMTRRDSYFAERRKQLEAKLDSREKSTQLTTKVEDKVVVFEANAAERKQSARLSSAAGAPAGTAAVFIGEPGGRELDRALWHQDRDHPQVWRQAVALPADASRPPVEFTIRREVTGGVRAARKLAISALYRGHVSNDVDSTGSFAAQLRVVRGIEPVAALSPAPQIKVKGSRHSITELIFIVDASDSMKENVRGKEGVAILERKWTIAKSAMQTILSELQARQSDWAANDEEWRAGLLVYGHRAAWTEKMNRVYYNDAATAADRQAWAAEGVVPQGDVEVLVQPARFDDELAGRIVAALNRAGPWGQTPLYYSLREAVKELEKTAKPGGDQPNRHIILVTDGVNNNPRPAKDGADVGPEAVNAALRAFKSRYNAPIHIDVVYFGMVQERDRNDLKSLTRFVQEATDLAGTRPGEKSDHMHMAESPENLIYSVRSAVERNRLRFRVVRAGAAADDGGYLPANSTWTAPAAVPLPDKFSVQIDGSPESAQEVRLEGGEGLVLQFKRDKLEFEAHPADKSLLKRIIVGTGRNRLFVHPFMPASAGVDVLFKYGEQYAETARFTPRPSDFWAEVTPLRQDDDGTQHEDEDEPALFFDRSFLAGQRMPILQFQFPGWPAQANAARVKLWLRFPDERGRSPVEPTRIKYRDVLQASAARDGAFSLPDFPVLLRAVETPLGNGIVRITIVEQQVDDVRLRDRCRIECSSKPETVSRRYFLGEGRAEHVFEFSEGTKFDAAGLELLVTPSATLKKNAIKVPADDADIRPLPVGRSAAAGEGALN